MEQLTLEHLAPYLPYGLKWLDRNKNKYNTCWMSRKKLCLISVNGIGELEKLTWDSVNRNRVKPILRPLSDLTKAIDYKTIRFIPYDNLSFIERMEMFESGQTSAEFAVLKECFNFHEADFRTSSIAYGVMKKLFKWHFDVFGLIEQGLAIDMNTLEQALK